MLGQRRQIVDRHIVFARRRAQREQPLLAALQLVGVVIGGAQGGFQMRPRLFQPGQRGIERLDHRLDQRRRLRLTALQPAQRAGDGAHRRLLATDDIVRLAQVFGDLLDLHHVGAPLRERRLLARLGAELAELVDRMAQPVGFATGALDLGAVFLDRGLGLAARVPQHGKPGGVLFQAAIGIEQPPVGRGVDQRAVVVLAVDLDQRAAQLLHHLHAHRLVVDEGAGAPVGELHAAQDQLVLGGDAAIGKHCAHRMVGGEVKGCGHLPLALALAHQGLVAAPTQRERERVEQDRLAGAGLAGEHGKPVGEIDVEPIDQDDVADRKSGEHGAWPYLSFGVPGTRVRPSAGPGMNLVPGIHVLRIRHH